MAPRPTYEELAQKNRDLEQEILRCREQGGPSTREEARLHGLARSLREAVVVVDAEGLIRYWNPAAEMIFGYGGAEVAGREAKILVPERYHRDFDRGLEAFKARGGDPAFAMTYTSEALARDGREIPVEFSLTVLPAGGPWCGMAVIRDITPRRRVEEEVRCGLERLQVMVDNAHCPMILGDLETLEIIEVNRATTELYGFCRQELLQMKFPELGAESSGEEPPGDGDFIRAVLKRPVCVHRKKRGAEFPVEIEFSAFMWRGRKVFCAVLRTLEDERG